MVQGNVCRELVNLESNLMSTNVCKGYATHGKQKVIHQYTAQMKTIHYYPSL